MYHIFDNIIFKDTFSSHLNQLFVVFLFVRNLVFILNLLALAKPKLSKALGYPIPMMKAQQCCLFYYHTQVLERHHVVLFCIDLKLGRVIGGRPLRFLINLSKSPCQRSKVMQKSFCLDMSFAIKFGHKSPDQSVIHSFGQSSRKGQPRVNQSPNYIEMLRDYHICL